MEADTATSATLTGGCLPEQEEEFWTISPLPVTTLVLDYGLDCIAFAENVLKIERTPGQILLGLPWYTPEMKQFFETVAKGKYTLVLSGNGAGKTLSLAILAMTGYFAGFTVITTAPTYRQVKQLWAEIRTLKMQAERTLGRSLPGNWQAAAEEVTDPLKPKHALYGFTARVGAGEEVATLFQGKHGPKMMVLVDEGIGVQRPVYEAIDRVVLNDHPDGVVVACGNPTEEGSYAHELEELKNEDGTLVWQTVNINCENHPNVTNGPITINGKITQVIPGAVTKSFVALQRAKGGGVDSAYYRTSVQGRWPGQKKDALILLDWIEKAIRKSEHRLEDDAIGIKRTPDPRGVALGLDVAGEGDNLTVLTGCQDFKLFWPKLSIPCWHRGRNHEAAVTLLITAIKEIPRVLSIAIDDTGLGASVSATLWERRSEMPEIHIFVTKGARADPSSIIAKVSILRINFGGTPTDDFSAESLARMRDVLWWCAREDLRDDSTKKGTMLLPTQAEWRAVGFPSQHDLRAQIMAPVLYKDERGRLHVVDKSTVKDVPKKVAEKLPNISPDLAHSAILAWWSWKQLSERQNAPVTTQQHFDAKLEAEISAMQNRHHQDVTNFDRSRMPAIFRRSR